MAGAERTENVGLRLSRPIMKYLTFDKSSKDKYAELRNFKLELKNMSHNYNIRQTERVLIIKKLARQARPITIKKL